MSGDNYDDGLVHGHAWAKEPPRPGVLIAPPSREVHDPALAAAMSACPEAQEVAQPSRH